MGTTPDIGALKARMRSTWMAGDFGQIARFAEQECATFVNRLGLQPGMQVLDVACGTGNQSLPAARAGATVTGVDIATNLLAQARQRAANEGLAITFQEGDAEALPFPDASFDVVLTMFGAMFAPRPDLTAAELLRVCKPGGRVAMGNWTPTGFVGTMFRLTAQHVPPPPGVPPPTLWGDEATVRQRLGAGASAIRCTPRFCDFHYPFPPAEVVDYFRRYFGPTQRAFEHLDAAGQQALRDALVKVWTDNNLASDGTTRVPGEYLEVEAIRA